MTKTELIALRADYEALGAAYDTLLDARRNAASTGERVEYDLRIKRAFDAWWTAKKAYDEALAAFALAAFIAADEVP